MADQRHRTEKTGRRHYGKVIAAAAAALGLVLSAPGLVTPARAVDLTGDITISAPADTFEEIDQADVVLDYYLIAAANPVEGYDTYELKLDTAFAALAEQGVELNIPFDEFSQDYTEYSRDIGQKAAAIALADVGEDDGTGKEAETEPQRPGATRVALGEKADGLPGGLYLVIPHGRMLENYKKTVTGDKAPTYTEDGDVEWKEDESVLVTTAYSPSKVYTFAPILISLPSRQVTAEDGTVTPSHETGEPGEWVNSIEATLKANEDVRYGLLHIIKNLDDIEERMGEDGKTYLPADPMTCVYDVTATLNGAQVYHKQVSIVLDAAGSHTLTLDYIPVGADVRVEEIYSGASYTIHPDDTTVKGGDGTIIIPADRETWASATFRNYYDENDRGGGSWTNRYTMLEDRVDPDNVDQSEEGSADILMPTPEPEPPVQQ